MFFFFLNLDLQPSAPQPLHEEEDTSSCHHFFGPSAIESTWLLLAWSFEPHRGYARLGTSKGWPSYHTNKQDPCCLSTSTPATPPDGRGNVRVPTKVLDLGPGKCALSCVYSLDPHVGFTSKHQNPADLTAVIPRPREACMVQKKGRQKKKGILHRGPGSHVPNAESGSMNDLIACAQRVALSCNPRRIGVVSRVADFG